MSHSLCAKTWCWEHNRVDYPVMWGLTIVPIMIRGHAPHFEPDSISSCNLGPRKWPMPPAGFTPPARAWVERTSPQPAKPGQAREIQKTHGFSKRSALHRNGTASETFIISDTVVKTQEIKNRTQFRPQLMWWQPPNVQKIWPEQTETPHSSHGSSCTFCDLDGQIAESTDTWMRQSAWCLVAYPIVSVATKELSES